NVTPLIGFGCNINPIIALIKQCGEVTWGNPPHPPIISKIICSDWCIQVFWSDQLHNSNNKDDKNLVLTDPILKYEIQIVECMDDEDVSNIFPKEDNYNSNDIDNNNNNNNNINNNDDSNLSLNLSNISNK